MLLNLIKAHATPELWENTFLINPKTKEGEKRSFTCQLYYLFNIYKRPEKQFNCGRLVTRPTQRAAPCGPFIKPVSPTLELHLKASSCMRRPGHTACVPHPGAASEELLTWSSGTSLQTRRHTLSVAAFLPDAEQALADKAAKAQVLLN